MKHYRTFNKKVPQCNDGIALERSVINYWWGGGVGEGVGAGVGCGELKLFQGFQLSLPASKVVKTYICSVRVEVF